MKGNLVRSVFSVWITGSEALVPHPNSNLEQGWEWDSLVCPLANSASWGQPRDTLLSHSGKLRMVKK